MDTVLLMVVSNFMKFLYVLLILGVVESTVPHDLSNFHGEYACDERVRLVKPRSFADVKAAVLRHRRVVAVGTGHSWNRVEEFFCPKPPEDDGTAATIVTTTIDAQTIDVIESEMAVWVSVGIKTWDLMVYLGDYITPSAPRGYVLGMTPLALNQTVVGAVATGTHGSSLRYSSLSNQVIGFRVILANGTETEITPNSHPLHFRAFQVNVGRLGVVTHVKMRIIKETLVKRTLSMGIPHEVFMSKFNDAQEMYKHKKTIPKWMQEMQAQWIPTTDQFLTISLEDVNEAPSATPLDVTGVDAEVMEFQSSAEFSQSHVQYRRQLFDVNDVADGVTWKKPDHLPIQQEFYSYEGLAARLARGVMIMPYFFGNRTDERHIVCFNSPEMAAQWGRGLMHDDYGIAIPASKMADCLEGALALLKSMQPDIGLRTFMYLRFINKENGLLSVAHDDAQMWIGVQDFVYYHQEVRQRNIPFQKLIAYLVTSPKCSPARMHWGKAGWPDQGCWNGADSYGLNWCHFGCVVRELDPENKFIGSAPGTWNWEGAHLDKCCGASGYDSTIDGCDCSVKPLRPPDECPEAPFYTNR